MTKKLKDGLPFLKEDIEGFEKIKSPLTPL